MTKPATLAAKITAAIHDRKPARLRWHDRVAKQHRAALEEVKAAYRRGDYVGGKKSIAAAIAATLRAEGVADIQYQGVLQWLEREET